MSRFCVAPGLSLSLETTEPASSLLLILTGSPNGERGHAEDRGVCCSWWLMFSAVKAIGLPSGAYIEWTCSVKRPRTPLRLSADGGGRNSRFKDWVSGVSVWLCGMGRCAMVPKEVLSLGVES